jgi:RHH-type transcriptional regulator, proline utilization regulon repressor / proline dehydrogenase / delta 1-pyrroline-5-carboxylate dehydrogenase
MNVSATLADCRRWDELDGLKFQDEAEVVERLLAQAPFDPAQRASVAAMACSLVGLARAGATGHGAVQSLIEQFSLSTQQGLALMSLAEAFLRTPDDDTRDRLIAEKIGRADWAAYFGRSDSSFVKVSTLSLFLTGKLVGVEPGASPGFAGRSKRLAARLGEPVIRRAVAAAIKKMGGQFVLAATIGNGLKRARKEDYLCSFDMLGEGAQTAADARRYEDLYAAAIEAVGREHTGDPEAGHSISVKLSALFPRYEAVNQDRVFAELYPRLKRLALLAASYGLNLTLDAEEADRLVLSLKIAEMLAHDDELDRWTGLGVVVQCYQKRAVQVIERLADLARRSRRRIMVRLVKGAYWDSEIKHAQVAGYPDYPVFTTKPATDLSYLVCAKALIAASPALYPQFATHNAHTLAAVLTMVEERAKGQDIAFECQRLHGMGEALYAAVKQRCGSLRLRAYAPIGGHADLLPYLVRRLLENGANSSFVHGLLDPLVPVEKVVQDPIALVTAGPSRHPKIPLPAEIYGAGRRNSAGLDLSQRSVLDRLAKVSPPVVQSAGVAVRSPVDGAVIGRVVEADLGAIETAVNAASMAWPRWDRLGGPARGRILRNMGDILQENIAPLVALLNREAGKTLADSVAEVREAVDFCRYYAGLAETRFGGLDTLAGPVGETNQLELRGRGVFVCISP